MAIRLIQRRFFGFSGTASSPLRAAATASPRFRASVAAGELAASASVSLRRGSRSDWTFSRAASTAGVTLSSASSIRGPNFSRAWWAAEAPRVLASSAYGASLSAAWWAYGLILSAAWWA